MVAFKSRDLQITIALSPVEDQVGIQTLFQSLPSVNSPHSLSGSQEILATYYFPAAEVVDDEETYVAGKSRVVVTLSV